MMVCRASPSEVGGRFISTTGTISTMGTIGTIGSDGGGGTTNFGTFLFCTTR